MTTPPTPPAPDGSAAPAAPAQAGHGARAHSFNAAAAQYAANRPSYPPALFDALEELTGRPLQGARVVVKANSLLSIYHFTISSVNVSDNFLPV